MNWMLRSVSLIKSAAVCVSVATMCATPIAQGAAAANQKSLISQYLKDTGLITKRMTVGEFWKSVRHVYPPTLQKQMDAWVSLNRNELMPKVEATAFKDADGKEQVRLTLTKDNQSTTLTFTNDEDKPLRVNNVSLTRKELLNYNKFNDIARKIAKNDPIVGKALKTGQQKPLLANPVLSPDEYRKLSPRQRAEYMVRMRAAMEAADKVYKVRYGVKTAFQQPTNKYEFALQFLFGDKVTAGALTGKPCIIAGYISKYGDGDSCGSDYQHGPLNADLSRQMKSSGASCGGQSACNPLVYGYSPNGSAFCVPSKEVQYATRYCDSKSPVVTPEDKKRIVESYLKHQGKDVNLKLNEEGKIPEEQMKDIAPFLQDLGALISHASVECGQEPLSRIKKAREEQNDACSVLETRMISLQTFAVAPEPPAPPSPLPNPPTQTCNDTMPGTTKDSEGNCACGEGQRPGEGGICVVIEADGGGGDLPRGKSAVKGVEECGFWCRNKNWIVPVGAGLVGLGLFWLLMKQGTKSKSSTPEYVPPAPVPEPDSPGNPTTPPPVVGPPPAPVCPSPNTLVNGVCTAPVVVPPPPVDNTSEGGSKIEAPGRATGVR